MLVVNFKLYFCVYNNYKRYYSNFKALAKYTSRKIFHLFNKRKGFCSGPIIVYKSGGKCH